MNEQLVKEGARRSRERGYRADRPGIWAVSEDGCDHMVDCQGACVLCNQQVLPGPVDLSQSG